MKDMSNQRKVIDMKKIIRGNTFRPDAQAFDEVIISTVNRYKTSELPGDGWRISVNINFLRNGIVKHHETHVTIESAIMALGGIYHNAFDHNAYFASEDGFCDQEGCKETATVFLKKKSDFCRDGHETKIVDDGFNGSKIRQFCEAHKKRGDCGLDDADSNYQEIF